MEARDWHTRVTDIIHPISIQCDMACHARFSGAKL